MEEKLKKIVKKIQKKAKGGESTFSKLFIKFEEDNNKKNYDNLVKYLTHSLKQIKKKFKINPMITLTDKQNKLFFNSTYGEKNTYYNYIHGHIKWNDCNEKKVTEKSEENGYAFKMCDDFCYFSIKIGSNITVKAKIVEIFGGTAIASLLLGFFSGPFEIYSFTAAMFGTSLVTAFIAIIVQDS